MVDGNSANLNLWSLVFIKAVFWVHYSPFNTTNMWNDLQDKIILYADDTTFYAEVTFLSDHINVANFLNRDLAKI